jgi:hypothetical protein
MKEGILNRTVGKLSSGTRVIILKDNNKPWKKRGDVISSGFITVQLRTPPSYKLREQGFPHDGVFDVEIDAVTILRSRSEVITRKEKHPAGA